jgi:hypothetical protein
MLRYYKLDGREVVSATREEAMALFEDDTARRVAETVRDGVRVSTVFLVLDHGFLSEVPVVFETLVFGGPADGEMARCATYDEAEQMHEEMCKTAFRSRRNLRLN